MKNIKRCGWCEGNSLYEAYHDEEWGVPVHDDRIHFEFLILEGAQAGLNWLTILKKRENYRKAYNDFDPEIVSKYNEEKIQELINNPGIVRNKLKIRASVVNAKLFLEIQKEFGSFDNYIWSFVENKPVVNSFKSIEELPATSNLSDLVSKDLKTRGFKFVGSTIIYAHLQATGIINDHLESCFRYKEVSKMK